MTTEHDFDGHGGCAPGCRQCRIEEQAATIARLEGELRDVTLERDLNEEHYDEWKTATQQQIDEFEKLFVPAVERLQQAEAERDALKARVAKLREWMAEYPNDRYTGAWWLAEFDRIIRGTRS